MRTIAILAPPADGISPEKYERARMAMLEQMMLLARGLPVTHPAVRAAAELVGSALAADPIEFALGAAVVGEAGVHPASIERKDAVDLPAPEPESSVLTLPVKEPTADQTGRRESYDRYLSTILSTQPEKRRGAA